MKIIDLYVPVRALESRPTRMGYGWMDGCDGVQRERGRETEQNLARDKDIGIHFDIMTSDRRSPTSGGHRSAGGPRREVKGRNEGISASRANRSLPIHNLPTHQKR